MGTCGLQCILIHHSKLITVVAHSRGTDEVVVQVRAGPKPCIIIDALMQDSAIQFGTGCDLNG